MFEVRTREMPARRLMLIQRRQHGDQTDAFVAEQRRHSSTGPFMLIFHGPVNDQAQLPRNPGRLAGRAIARPEAKAGFVCSSGFGGVI
jgi:hypothetical protein